MTSSCCLCEMILSVWSLKGGLLCGESHAQILGGISYNMSGVTQKVTYDKI